MQYLLLIICIIASAIQSPLKKIYQVKSKNGVFLFSAMISFVAALFFGTCALASGTISFEASALLYALGFGICYAITTVSGILALGCGSLTLTSLIVSYSLIVPTIYGFFRSDNSIYLSQLIGIVFLLFSLYLSNYVKNTPKSTDDAKQNGSCNSRKGMKISLKWIIYVVLAFTFNAGCVIVQQEQQLAFNGAYKNEFMFVALMFVTIVLLGISFFYERKDFKTTLRFGTLSASLVGIFNGLNNLLVMIVAEKMIPVFIFFPIVSAGGLIISYILSITLFKERFSTIQKVGILLGMFALIFLNLEFVVLF